MKEEIKRCKYCQPPTTNEKECFNCKQIKDLEEFEETQNAHLLKQKAAKGRRYSCKSCPGG